MAYEVFNHTVDDYAAELTCQSHQTLHWLNRNGYLSNEDTEELLSSMVVVPIRNQPKFGQRILDRFFGHDSKPNSFVFPISIIEHDNPEDRLPTGKPNLTVVE